MGIYCCIVFLLCLSSSRLKGNRQIRPNKQYTLGQTTRDSLQTTADEKQRANHFIILITFSYASQDKCPEAVMSSYLIDRPSVGIIMPRAEDNCEGRSLNSIPSSIPK